jgi:hypothetical protein
MSVLIFWIVTPCGLEGRKVDTNVLEGHAASIFRPKINVDIFTAVRT